jgi:hypothetical protein
VVINANGPRVVVANCGNPLLTPVGAASYGSSCIGLGRCYCAQPLPLFAADVCSSPHHLNPLVGSAAGLALVASIATWLWCLRTYGVPPHVGK